MNYVQTLLGVAIAVAFATAAIAAEPTAAPGNKAGKNQVVPGRSDLQPGAAPTVQRMDDNGQRQHDRNAASKTLGAAKPAAPVATGTNEVRDWAAIDKNKDHLISPEEMEDYLKQGRATSVPKP